MSAGAIALIVLALFVLIIAMSGVRIVPQAKAGIVERLGRYQRTLDAGLTLIVPFMDRVKPLIDLREQVVAFPPQPVITEDNLVVGIDTVIYFTVTDPRAATYEIANPLQAIEQLTVTTLRNVIGGLTLEETLTSRDNINSQLRVVLDEATGKWGIRVNRVELKSVEPPRTVQEAMEKQMPAERDRRGRGGRRQPPDGRRDRAGDQHPELVVHLGDRPVDTRHHDTADLLRTEHAVARVLAECDDEATAYPRLLAAVGRSLGWDAGTVWLPDGEALRCVETWQAPESFERISRDVSLAPGEGLPGRVCASGEPAWIPDVSADSNFPRASMAVSEGLRAAFGFPIRGGGGVLGAIEFLAREPRDSDDNLLATMTSLGGRIGHCVERWRAEERLRESEARKGAILAAAFDCVITMDSDGNVVEVNPAAERTFGYAAEEMVGRELAELIIPPRLREPHRRGVHRHVATGEGRMVGHPVELPAMRADGSEFMVEIAITRPVVPGPPLFTGFLRDISARKRAEQELHELANEQAALRRVATAVASEAPEERVFAVVTEEVGRLLGAHTANMVRFEPDGSAIVLGEWSSGRAPSVPVGTYVALDGPTIAARIRDSGRPQRIESYDDVPGSTAEMLRSLGFRSGVGTPIKLAGRLWGAVMVSTLETRPFPDGSEQRIADFAELVSLALANADARRELAASRARIVETGDAERRRLERNLHDGAQQRLVGLAPPPRLCGQRLARPEGETPELVQRPES